MQHIYKKKLLGSLKTKNENFGNKTFQSAELRKCSVLRKKSFWEAKNRKMKTLEIKHSRVQNSGNAAFCEKKVSGKLKIENGKLWNKKIPKGRIPEMQRFGKKSVWES